MYAMLLGVWSVQPATFQAPALTVGVPRLPSMMPTGLKKANVAIAAANVGQVV